MQENKKHDYLYRHGVGIMLINSEKMVFVGKRIDTRTNAWQMPQGGLENGEDEEEAARRELEEETGITSVKIISKSREHFYYHLPYGLQKKFWNGEYIGQRQRWFLMHFVGDESEISLDGERPEFGAWQWHNIDGLGEIIVPFKRELYQGVMTEFMPIIQSF